MQKRWSAGVFYGLGFISGFCGVMLTALRLIASFYRMGFEGDTYTPEPVNIRIFIAPLALAISFYILNIFDIIISFQRIGQKTREDAFIKANLKSSETEPPEI